MIKYISYFAWTPFILSCGNPSNENANNHIILGDSTTIVTEYDSQYLRNNFDDMTFKSSEMLSSDTQNSTVDSQLTMSADTTSQQTNPAGSGIEIKLNDIVLIMNDRNDKQIRKSSNVSYVTNTKNYPQTVTSKNGDGIIKYRQVHVVYFTKDGQRIKLQELGDFRTDWYSVKSQNSLFQFPALDSKPSFKNVKAADIQKSINAQVSKLKSSQKDKNKLVADIKSITSLQHKNIEVVIEKVEWDIQINNKSEKLYFTF